MPRVTGPEPGPLGTIGALLHYAFYLERNPDGAVVDAYRQALTDFTREVDGSGVTEAVLQFRVEQRELWEVLALVS